MCKYEGACPAADGRSPPGVPPPGATPGVRVSRPAVCRRGVIDPFPFDADGVRDERTDPENHHENRYETHHEIQQRTAHPPASPGGKRRSVPCGTPGPSRSEGSRRPGTRPGVASTVLPQQPSHSTPECAHLPIPASWRPKASLLHDPTAIIARAPHRTISTLTCRVPSLRIQYPARDSIGQIGRRAKRGSGRDARIASDGGNQEHGEQDQRHRCRG